MTQKEFNERYIKARRSVIEQEFKHLNPVQRDAVMTTDGPLLLLAGAGSGKTTVLINRIANLMKYGNGSDSDFIPEWAGESELSAMEDYLNTGDKSLEWKAQNAAKLNPVEPWRIIAITFTNKAANELKDRLERMLGPSAMDIWAMTFHSACAKILRYDCEKLGYEKGFTIYDTSDSQSIMKRILKELNIDEKQLPHRSVLGEISRAKDAMTNAAEFLKNAEYKSDIRRISMGKAYVEYEKRLKSSNAMDFDDLIYNTVRLLTEHPDTLDHYSRKFKYVLIDEYQDTNNLQYELSSKLACAYKNICVVGDDDQSIYKFRGATIENILNFESQYANARMIRLEQNYRSTGNILGAANGVIENNRGRKGKKLWTESVDGDKLTLYVGQSEHEESRFVANQILDNKSQGENWRDHAVLYRMNAQSNQLEYAFKRAGIPYRIVGGTRFFDRAEVKDMISYLAVIVSPNDDLRLTRIINTPTRGIGARTVEIAQEIALANGLSLFDVVKNADKFPELQRQSINLRKFANMILEFRHASTELNADELYEQVLETTGYITALEEKQTDENISRIENVREIKTNIINYMKDSGETGISGFLDEVALYTDMDNVDRDADCVVMMTMHSAKGLEFPNVFIVGMEEGIFPSSRCIGEQEEMEEERRLCYVGLTRAKERLFLCCAKQRMLFGKTTANRPSRFVSEIPSDFINRPDNMINSQQNYDKHSYSAPLNSSSRPKIAPSPKPNGAEALAKFNKGDMISHKAFGRGMIVAMTPMGGDALIEIAFDNVGTKKLMLRVASQHMTKE